jgi:hypothetical protein
MCADRVYYSARGGMFCSVMRPNRTLRVGFALLFALMLPLQGYAAMPDCGQPGHAIRYPAHMAAHHSAAPHCTQEPAASHHSGCGDCCCAIAIALAPIGWAAPRLSAPEISDTLIWSPPAVALDRLDRPPRFTAV